MRAGDQVTNNTIDALWEQFHDHLQTVDCNEGAQICLFRCRAHLRAAIDIPGIVDEVEGQQMHDMLDAALRELLKAAVIDERCERELLRWVAINREMMEFMQSAMGGG